MCVEESDVSAYSLAETAEKPRIKQDLKQSS